MAEDRPGPDDGDVDAVARRGLVAEQPRRAAWPGRRPRAGGPASSSVDRVRARGCRRSRSTTCARPCRHPASRAASRTFAVPTTLTDQNSSWSFASGTWATLCRITSTPSHAVAQRVAVADVADHDLGVGRVGRRLEVEDPDLVAPGQGQVGDDGPEVAAAARDQDRPRHRRLTGRRVQRSRDRGRSGCSRACPRPGPPSARSRGRARAALMSQAIVSLQLAQHVHRLHVAVDRPGAWRRAGRRRRPPSAGEPRPAAARRPRAPRRRGPHAPRRGCRRSS